MGVGLLLVHLAHSVEITILREQLLKNCIAGTLLQKLADLFWVSDISCFLICIR